MIVVEVPTAIASRSLAAGSGSRAEHGLESRSGEPGHATWWRESKRAYLGISLGRLYYSTARLNAYCSWAAVNSPRGFAFLIGDDIYAYTLRAFSGLAESTATKRARAKGDDIERQLRRIALARKVTVEIVRWADLSQFDLYRAIFRTADALRASSPGFREALRQQAVTNLRARLDRLSPSLGHPAKRRWELLELYVMHEIAGLITMSESHGYEVEIYPGPELQVIEDIYGDRWPELRALLPEFPRRLFKRLEMN
jgi:tRNA-dependent cyclodipeptide synthase